MSKKIKIYYAHSMSNLSRTQSIANALKFRKMLGPKYEVRIPELWQSEITFETIFKRDTQELSNCDIVFFDPKYIGEIVKGKVVIGRGAFEEIGFAKAIGKIVIELNDTNVSHPFSCGATKVVSSFKEATKYIKDLKL